MDTSITNQCTVQFLQTKAGEYKVLALNSMGQATSVAMVSVEEPVKPEVHFVSGTGVTKEEWYTTTIQENLRVGRAPQFVDGIPATMEISSDHEVITVDVLVDAEPVVEEFTWFINDQRLVDSSKAKFYHKENRARIEITKEAVDTSVRDGDELTVVARNSLGTATSLGRIFIQSKRKSVLDESLKFFCESRMNS